MRGGSAWGAGYAAAAHGGPRIADHVVIVAADATFVGFGAAIWASGRS